MLTQAVELTVIFVLAFLVESLVEYFLAKLFEKYGLSDYLKYAAALVGIGLCFAYRIDILLQLVGMTPVHPIVGYVISGIIIGRGSNFLNDLIDLVRGDRRLRSRQSGQGLGQRSPLRT